MASAQAGALERWELFKAVGRLTLDVPRMAPWARVNPAALLRRLALHAPHDLALAYLDERYTWGELAGRANRYAGLLSERGVRAGDVVALAIDNRPDFVFALMGLNQLGAVASLINTNLSGSALAHALRVCDAKKILVGEECLQSVTDVARELDWLSLERDLLVKLDQGTDGSAHACVIDQELDAIDPARRRWHYTARNADTFCYIYTSGTTGHPKAAIVRNQRMLVANCAFGRLMHRCGPGDVIYVPLPLYHSSAMFLGWGAALVTGAAMALRRKFSASAFWGDVARYEATSFLYIGELCRYLLNRPPEAGERAHTLRVAVGNGMRPDIWQPFQQRFGVPVVREFYGSTEGNAPILNVQGKPGMIGRRSRGQLIARCDLTTGDVLRNADGRCESVEPGEVGLLLARISKVLSFDGYVDREATDKKILSDVLEPGDRFFDTGDLIELHEDRWLSFADRAGDTFRWKGENVSTNEVAEILDAAPGVLEANVYGVRLPGTDGRAGMAAIRVQQGFDLVEFAAYSRERLTSYQRPLLLRLLQGDMRVTSTFKHRKVEYREEGFDRSRIDDPLYALFDGQYRAIDDELFAQITAGDVIPG